MSFKTLIERAFEILVGRGVIVLFEQILLRHEGVTLDVQSVVMDYAIVSEDTIEVLVSRSISSPSLHSVVDSTSKVIGLPQKGIGETVDRSGDPPRDIFLPPRDIWGKGIVPCFKRPGTNCDHKYH
jgi:hypothetical protein